MNRVIHADHALPGDAPPLADAALVVADDGGIVEVGPAEDVLPRHAGAPVERVRGVVFPGLVNAHAHLELSALRGEVPGGRGFVPWVGALVARRSARAPEQDADAIAAAVAELVRFGTVAVGEVTNSLAAARALSGARVGGVVFHEVFGLDRDATLRRIERMRDAPDLGPDLAYAPAPHTLYTTHPDAVRALIGAARARGAPTSLHFGEHAAERRALEAGDGPMVDWLATRGESSHVWPRLPLCDLADELGALAPDVALVHLTDLRPDELARVAARGAPVVLCPRSNLHIEARLPPLLAMRAAGIEAALGTDSLASNASLDVLAEARALADRFPTVPAWELVRMATLGGARALGRPDLGRLAKGARPGVLAVTGEVRGDPAAFLLSNLRAPRSVLVRRGAP